MEGINEKLDQPETIFFHLLDDDKMFTHSKFLKALQQQKARKVDEYLKSQIGSQKGKQGKKGRKGNKSHKTGAHGSNSKIGHTESAMVSPIHNPQSNLASPINVNASQRQSDIHKSSKPHSGAGQSKKKDEGEKRRQKQLDLIDVYGLQYQGAKQVEGYSFFNDLNYGDMAMIFENPFYDFQLKERQEIELHQFNHLNLLGHKTKGMLNLSPKKTKKMELDKAKQTKKINEKFKKLTAEDAKKNVRIDLEQAYDFYSKYINLKPENQIESRKDEIHQKQAFANALIFFSDRYYVNDMARVKPDQQPYSDACTQSLRDFLVDSMFEFSIFHKIAKRKFYTEKETDGKDHAADSPGRSKIGVKKGQEQQPNPLGEIIQTKPFKLQNFLERALSKNQEGGAFKQVTNEETNYFFIKRPDEINLELLHKEFPDDRTIDPKQIARNQYNEYIKLTKRLNDAAMNFYNDCNRTDGHQREQVATFGGAASTKKQEKTEEGRLD